MATAAAVPAVNSARAPIASEGLVTSCELENLSFTAAGKPDEGVVYALEESAKVSDASLFAVAPKAGLAVRLGLHPDCKLDKDSLDQLIARVKEVAERPDLGPLRRRYGKLLSTQGRCGEQEGQEPSRLSPM